MPFGHHAGPLPLSHSIPVRSAGARLEGGSALIRQAWMRWLCFRHYFNRFIHLVIVQDCAAHITLTLNAAAKAVLKMVGQNAAVWQVPEVKGARAAALKRIVGDGHLGVTVRHDVHPVV